MMMREATYVLPIRRSRVPHDDDLPAYLARVRALVDDVIVVDGSAGEVFEAFGRTLPAGVRHLRVDPAERGRNGKVAGVRTALRHARAERVVIADDDVRYDDAGLSAVLGALDDADIVRPQNYFDPLPWHALLDSGRSLIARTTGGDWPGTLAVRRATFARAGGYDPDVLFENLELVRTIRACGGRERRLDGTFVRRRPPAAAQYLGQRVRQAYDEFARPGYLAAQLSLAPLAFVLWRRDRARGIAALALAAIALAETGRRRAGATRVFPPAAAALAPLWVAERAVTSWLAVGARLRGGVRYAGGRVARAATPPAVLRARYRSAVA